MDITKNTLTIPEGFPYVYETHLHTNQGSACGQCTGKEMADACYDAGYTGIIVTDHFFYGNTRVDRSLAWEDWVEEFCKGYEDAKKEGDRIGLQVFFGWESNYKATEFLINGLSKEWLLAHPEIKDCSIEEQFQLVHEGGGMVVHCHPYRKEAYIPEIRLFPEYVDAVETINATHASLKSTGHNVAVWDEYAAEYAGKHNLPATAGSDIHKTDLLLGGMAFKEKLKDSKDFIKTVLSTKGMNPHERPYILLNGNESLR